MEVEIQEFGVRIRLIVEPVEARPEPVESEETPEPETMEPEPEPLKSSIRLEQELRQWRREEAIRRGMPSYIVMTEKTIRAIVEARPVTEDTFREIRGVGPKTWEMYGGQLLELVQESNTEEE